MFAELQAELEVLRERVGEESQTQNRERQSTEGPQKPDEQSSEFGMAKYSPNGLKRYYHKVAGLAPNPCIGSQRYPELSSEKDIKQKNGRVEYSPPKRPSNLITRQTSINNPTCGSMVIYDSVNHNTTHKQSPQKLYGLPKDTRYVDSHIEQQKDYSDPSIFTDNESPSVTAAHDILAVLPIHNHNQIPKQHYQSITSSAYTSADKEQWKTGRFAEVRNTNLEFYRDEECELRRQTDDSGQI